MRKRALLFAAVVLATAPATAQAPPSPQAPRHAGVLRGDTPDAMAEVIPPERYQRDAGVITVFSQQAVRSDCANKVSIACTKVYKDGTVLLIVPNPCALAGKELYATILCHELGHVNGWKSTHGD